MKKLIPAIVASMSVFFYCGIALSSEQITVTTYYPSPGGAYNQLLVQDLTTNRATFNPYSNLASVPSPREGMLVYVDNNTSDATPGQFWYYGGGGWGQPSGGGGSYVAWGTSDCASGWARAYHGVAVVAAAETPGFSPPSDSIVGISNVICKAGSDFPSQSHNAGGVIYWRSHDYRYWDRGNAIACAVCVK